MGGRVGQVHPVLPGNVQLSQTLNQPHRDDTFHWLFRSGHYHFLLCLWRFLRNAKLGMHMHSACECDPRDLKELHHRAPNFVLEMPHSNPLPSFNQLPNLGLLNQKRSFKDIELENDACNDLRGRKCLITGGTSGIGAAGEVYDISRDTSSMLRSCRCICQERL